MLLNSYFGRNIHKNASTKLRHWVSDDMRKPFNKIRFPVFGSNRIQEVPVLYITFVLFAEVVNAIHQNP